MLRYRSPIKATHETIPLFRNVKKLGRLISIKGYRFSATVKGSTGPLHMRGMERVMVRGEKGTARFGGVCWGYGGEGPHGLRDLFIACGISKEQAEAWAFNLHRGDEDGTDWEIMLAPVLVKGYFGFEKKAA